MEARKKVAAYVRVSTNSEEQLTSYEAQVDYYTRYIKAQGEWDFVKVYTDEGISATNTKKRDGFNNMIADALAGKIDLIITKSISRFVRLLHYLRMRGRFRSIMWKIATRLLLNRNFLT